MAVLIAKLRTLKSTTPSPAERNWITTGSGKRSISGQSPARLTTKKPRAPSRLATNSVTRSASTSSLSSPRSQRPSHWAVISMACWKLGWEMA